MAEGSGQSTTPNQADDIKQRTSNLKNFLEELKHFIRYADRMNVFASYLGYVSMLPASESLALHPIPRSIMRIMTEQPKARFNTSIPLPPVVSYTFAVGRK
jgi:hypothetical protein